MEAKEIPWHVQVVSEFTFKEMDFTALNNTTEEAQAKKEEFIASTIAQVAKSANVEEGNVKIVEIRPGSVVVIIEIAFSASQVDQGKEFIKTAGKHPEKLFDEDFTKEYGTPDLKLKSVPESLSKRKNKSKSLGTGAVVAIVLIGAIVVVGASAWFVFNQQKKYTSMGTDFMEI